MKKGLVYTGTLREAVDAIANDLMETDREREAFIQEQKRAHVSKKKVNMAWKTIYKGNSEDEAGAAVINALKRVTPQLQQGVVKSGQDEDIGSKKTSDFAKEISSRYKGPKK